MSQLFYTYVAMYVMQPTSGDHPSNTTFPYFVGVAVAAGLLSTAIFGLKTRRTLSLQRAYPMYVVNWALNESVAVMGFVTAITIGPNDRMLQVLGASLVLNMVMMPRFRSF